MKPQIKLAEALTPDGGQLALFEHDGAYAIRLNGQGLMESRASESEMVLGRIGTERLSSNPHARVLIGGLGLGFTLKSVLEHVGAGAKVEVAELLPAVIEWNRNLLRDLNGALLDDPRVVIVEGDVMAHILNASNDSYDAILLDIDNGPTAMVHDTNHRVYADRGLKLSYAKLRHGGRLVIWSAGEDDRVQVRLRRAGFVTQIVRAKRYPAARKAAITLYVGDKK